MIEFDGVSARRAPLALADIRLAWGPGVHAIIGAASDGGRTLLALAAGDARPRRGRVRVLGGAPTDTRVRRQVAHVAAFASLPDAMRVDEVLAMAAAIRGDAAQSAAERLAVLGVEALARRSVRSLSRGEARTVALAEAVTSARVRALLIDEPLVAIDARAAAHVAGALRAKGREGCTVLVATASLRDAGELGDDFVRMTKGVLSGWTSSADRLTGFAIDSVRLLMVAPDVTSARALAGRLAHHPDVAGVSYGAQASGAARPSTIVRIHGDSAVALAKAAAWAAIGEGVGILQLRIEPPALDEAQTAPAAGPASRQAVLGRAAALPSLGPPNVSRP